MHKNDNLSRLLIDRYAQPDAVGYIGSVEPEDKSWILYFGLDGKPVAYYPKRESDGTIIGNPIELS